MQHIGVSTKAYFGYSQTLDWLAEVRETVQARPGLNAAGIVPFVIPSSPVLAAALTLLNGTGVIVGAQDLSWSDGPLTGEVLAAMLAEMGVQLAELGHAERRSLFGETDAVIQRKHAAATAAGLTTLLCVGEDRRTDTWSAAAFCASQVEAVVPRDQATSILIAYEPVWAIGADRPADPGYVNGVVTELRSRLHMGFPSLPVSIIYGGSAGPGLLGDLESVDGLFLGRFAHSAANLGTVLDEALARSEPGESALITSSASTSAP